MAGLLDVVPDVTTLLALTAEDLAITLLELAQKSQAPRFTISEFVNPIWTANRPEFPHHQRTPVNRSVAEAMQWLLNEGLVIFDPEQSADYYCLTRKGRSITHRQDFTIYRQGRLLPTEILHPVLIEKIRPMFLRGDYEVAVFSAFKEVEVAVRKRAGLPDEQLGVTLMRTAFNPDKGALSDQQKVYSEREALMHLFASAIGHGKNPASHREVMIDAISAAQLIALASYLLGIIDAIVVSDR